MRSSRSFNIIKYSLLMILLALLYSTSTAKAFEEPIAGISTALSRYEKHIKSNNESQIDKYIEAYSLLNGIDSDLVRSVIFAESSGQADAVNRNKNGTTDSGLMQINSINHKWLSEEIGITDFMDPKQNIKAGCFILGGLSKNYESNHRILMAYNMGEKRTRELWNKGIRSSRYSRKVMDYYNNLKGRSE